MALVEQLGYLVNLLKAELYCLGRRVCLFICFLRERKEESQADG